MSTVLLAIDDVIGSEEINSRDIIRMLNEQKPTEINVTINSGGGSVFEALAIYDYLKNSSARVNVTVEGTAASAASFLMFAGDDKPKMTANSVIMIHNCHVPVVSMERMNSEEIREYIKGLQSDVDFMDKINDRMAKIYSDVTGISIDVVKQMMVEETWLWAEEALDKGFVSEVTEGIAVAASASKEDLEGLGYTNIPENYVNQLNNIDMSENKEKSFFKHMLAFFQDEVKAEEVQEESVEETVEAVEETVEAVEEVEATAEESTEEVVEEVSEEILNEPQAAIDADALRAELKEELMAELKAEMKAKKASDKAAASRKEVAAKEDVLDAKKEEIKDELGEYVLAQLKARM